MEKRFLLFTFTIFTVLNAICQNNDSIRDLNQQLSLRIDSMEQKITEDKWGTIILHHIHYSITNKSSDTVTFITNSCPSYNTYKLSVNDTTYRINTDIRCSLNALTRHIIPPNETISLKEYASMHSIHKFSNTDFVRFSIPIAIDGPNSFRVSGFNPDQKELIYQGKLQVVTAFSSSIKTKKRKKRKK
jgi:hypothetical protein